MCQALLASHPPPDRRPALDAHSSFSRGRYAAGMASRLSFLASTTLLIPSITTRTSAAATRTTCWTTLYTN
eukprot:4264002-Pleurochrysis_carterae.AAC.1